LDQRRRDRKKRIRREIFTRDDFTCCDCGWVADTEEWDGVSPLTDGNRTLTIDHIIEKALGGPSTKENFQTLCDKCNTKKSVHVGRLIREAQDAGMTLEEARKSAATTLDISRDWGHY
jgi:5-methylcytosine-specific restriction endonuclease McrA